MRRPGKRAARGFERGFHLRRVVAVVVDQREFPTGRFHLAVVLETPTDAVELLQRLQDRRVLDADLGADRDRGQRVEHVVAPGQIQHYVEGLRILAHGAKAHASAVVRDRLGAHRSPRGVLARAVGQHRLGDLAAGSRARARRRCTAPRRRRRAGSAGTARTPASGGRSPAGRCPCGRRRCSSPPRSPAAGAGTRRPTRRPRPR